MSNGLRYETGWDMPPSMAEKVAVQIARQMEAEAPPAEPAPVPVAEVDESTHIDDAPTVIALPVTAEELDHLINDTISYIWKLENKKKTTEEFGYYSRKALLEKLKKFRNEHFPDLTSCG